MGRCAALARAVKGNADVIGRSDTWRAIMFLVQSVIPFDIFFILYILEIGILCMETIITFPKLLT